MVQVKHFGQTCGVKDCYKHLEMLHKCQCSAPTLLSLWWDVNISFLHRNTISKPCYFHGSLCGNDSSSTYMSNCLPKTYTSSNWRTSVYSPFMLAFQRRKLNLFGARTICCEGAVIRKRTWIKASDPSIFEGFLLAFVTQYNLKKFWKEKNEHNTIQNLLWQVKLYLSILYVHPNKWAQKIHCNYNKKKNWRFLHKLYPKWYTVWGVGYNRRQWS